MGGDLIVDVHHPEPATADPETYNDKYPFMLTTHLNNGRKCETGLLLHERDLPQDVSSCSISVFSPTNIVGPL